MFLSLCAECVEFLSQRRSGAVLIVDMKKVSDRVLTTYIRYVLGWAASEEFMDAAGIG